MKQGFWGSILVIAACGGVSWTAVQLGSKPSTQISSMRAEIEALKQAQAQSPTIIREVQVVPAQPAAHGQTKEDLAGPERTAPGAPPDGSFTGGEEQKQQYLNARLELMQRQHSDEPTDPDWSKTATAAIEQTYSAQEFGALSMRTSCKTSLCRMDFSYSDPSAGPSAVRELLSKHPWPGRRSTTYDQERREGSAFFARDDFDLPFLDPRPFMRTANASGTH